ncbi:hypothetical protein GUITHDRAFT_102994 [Guillardia theta CCMP2712]|uniref:Uncharacterized protein n=1 Tax=Guillardia theta (strain CCMP2712) TaxID=905079 RepID=L1JRJ0_GUITC|nr:hypothetical protein GUITHDRAFT_102994 [Guillardia theta CCMP2712]EKX51072.1 hypothetical protein GUITHDRAFT_102994 [Guillardia theta CCMP2712]|eukprot:XP_005838052.1 hypothetical protein GUITHDRAFT_102994 [Guillardia theta CCMP2712]
MPSDRLDYALSSVVGMCFGAFISLIVDAALFEVGQSPYFAMLFGLCLIVIGGLIIWRVAPEPGERMTRWRFLVFVFSTLILSSGICCFLLNKDWLVGLSPAIKLPMYTILGTSLCFALTFSIVDLINQRNLCCNNAIYLGDVADFIVPPVASSSKQIYVVMISSIIMGGIFGLSFGLFDVEDDTKLHIRFDEDQAWNTFFGGIAGFFVGALPCLTGLIFQALQDSATHVRIAYEDDI